MDHSERQHAELIAHYEQIGPDIEAWSPACNVHFGYYRAGFSLFDRERMLNEMNRQVLERLRLTSHHSDFIVDLGCGVGATVRYAASAFPLKRILGLTVVPWQADRGNAWNRRAGLHQRAALEPADYTRTDLPPASVDGAIAIESACYAVGPAKDDFVREAARILRPGGRLVVADAFLKHPQRHLGPVSSRLHESMCRSFVLPELPEIGAFRDALVRHGFDEPVFEDISWRVAPSVLHAPAAVLGFALKKRLRGEPLGPRRVSNLRGSVLSALLGLNRRKVGYYLVSARRAGVKPGSN